MKINQRGIRGPMPPSDLFPIDCVSGPGSDEDGADGAVALGYSVPVLKRRSPTRAFARD